MTTMPVIRMTTALRRDRVHTGVRLGYAARQLARLLEVSPATIRRDIAAMPSLREETASWPDACRWTP